MTKLRKLRKLSLYIDDSVRIFENMEKILENPGESGRILVNPSESWRILEKPAKSLNLDIFKSWT